MKIGTVISDTTFLADTINFSTTRSSEELFEQVLALLQNFFQSNEAKNEVSDEQLKELQKELDKAKAAKAEDRRKIILTILQGLASVASIGASVVKIIGG